MKMNVNLNEVMAQFKPWDLSIDIDGIDYKVRPITLADLATLKGLKDLTEEQGFAFVNGLFEPKDVPVDATRWEHAKVGAVIGIITSYYSELASKNSRLAAEHVRSVAAATK